MRWRHTPLISTLAGVLAAVLSSPQLLGYGFGYGPRLPVYNPPHAPLQYVRFMPVPACRFGPCHGLHSYPYYFFGQPRIVVRPHPAIVETRVVIRDRTPARTSHQQRRFPEIDFWLLALEDGPIYAATDYWLEGETLQYVERNGTRSSVPLDHVDLSFTKRLNRILGTPFRLPRPGP